MLKQTKKWMSLLLAILMVVSVTACQDNDLGASEGDSNNAQVANDIQVANDQDNSGDDEVGQMTYVPGVYTSKQQGKDGDVEVIVTFDEHSIVSVEIGENNETEGIATEAMNRIPDAIVFNQDNEGSAFGLSLASGTMVGRIMNDYVDSEK